MKKIITIGRQFGCGGRQLGKELAKELNINYYDKELLAVEAKKTGLSSDFLQEYDEKATNSLLFSLVMNPHTSMFTNNGNNTLDEIAINAQRKAIEFVAEESCIIVGRCADYILRNNENVTKIFLSANKKDRIMHVMERDGFSEEEASKKIAHMDKERKAYYNYYTEGGWGEAANYDIALNMSKLTVEQAVKVIVSYLSLTRKISRSISNL